MVLVLGSLAPASGQSIAPENGSEDFYIFPIKPGVTNTLAGTMGELRSSHFHTGIDIRTGGVQGIPVQAAADGVISRVVVSPGGYGNTLYILHPNGETTVYAHLKEFSSPIQEYVRYEQYKRNSFAVNLFPKREMFKITQGDTLALSGNSGSSGGPHLHFDIRDNNQNVVNPLEYHFEEIVDSKKPEVRKVALKTMDIHSRINNQFGRFEFTARREGGQYVLDTVISVFGKIGVELYAFDRQNNTRFRTGINEIDMKLDDELVFNQVIDRISFSKTRNFYNHVNYEVIRNNGQRFHKLYVDDGNELDFYTTNSNKGIMVFDEACDHTISISMFDTHRNESILSIPITCQEPSFSVNNLNHDEEIDLNSYRIVDNTLMLFADQSELDSADICSTFYIDGNEFQINPDFGSGPINVYLWDLRKGLPDSVNFCNSTAILGLNALVPAGIPYQFYSENIDASFVKRSLFDTLYLEVDFDSDFMGDGELFVFGSRKTPLRSNLEVTLKPGLIYPDKSRTHAYTVDDSGNFGFTGGKWHDNKMIFKTRSLGSYTLLTDSISPYIKPLIVNRDRIVFTIQDKLSGIKEFKLLVDSNWILMNYDPKIKRIWSEKLDDAQPFEGPVVLSVVDNAGNENKYQINLAKYETKNR